MIIQTSYLLILTGIILTAFSTIQKLRGKEYRKTLYTGLTLTGIGASIILLFLILF